MRRLFSPALSLLVVVVVTTLWPVTGHAQTEMPIDHRLTNVKVYRDRALMTSVARPTLGPGTHLLVFSGLSPSFDKNSVSVSGEGGGIIQSVSARVSYLNRTIKPARMLQLEDSLHLLRIETDMLTDRTFVYEQEQAMILKNTNTGGNDKGVTAEEVAKLAAFYRARLLEVKGDLTASRRRLEHLNIRRQRNEQELEQLRVGRDKPTNEVVVTYKTETGARPILSLKYLVGGAGWVPKYDLRVPAVGQPISLSLQADVANRTGIDWNAVEISLSTADPAQGGTPPDLQPQYLTFYQPRPSGRGEGAMRKRAAAPMSAKPSESAGAGGDLAEEDEKMEAFVTTADYTVETVGGLSVDYQINLPYTIPTDGKPRQVDIRAMTLPATYAHFAVPKLDKDAFLRATIGGWEQYNLLPGNANVYFEGSYLTNTFLDPTITTDSLNVGLGRDGRVLVKRERVKDFMSKKFIGGKMVAAYGYSLEVRNTKKEAVTLLIEDQYPISQQSEIEVKLLSAEGAVNNINTGKLYWRLTLQPGETKKMSFAYEVKYPKDRPPYGI